MKNAQRNISNLSIIVASSLLLYPPPLKDPASEPRREEQDLKHAASEPRRARARERPQTQSLPACHKQSQATAKLKAKAKAKAIPYHTAPYIHKGIKNDPRKSKSKPKHCRKIGIQNHQLNPSSKSPDAGCNLLPCLPIL